MEPDDAISRFLSEARSDTSIPERHSIKCCCGSEDCAFLKHNQSALTSLERDICTASRIGKVSHRCVSLEFDLARQSRA